MDSAGDVRLLVADDVGFLKSVRYSPGAEASVVARWGEAHEGRGILCTTAPSPAQCTAGECIALAHASSQIEVVETQTGRVVSVFRTRDVTSRGGILGQACALSWLSSGPSAEGPLPPLLTLLKDGTVQLRRFEEAEAPSPELRDSHGAAGGTDMGDTGRGDTGRVDSSGDGSAATASREDSSGAVRLQGKLLGSFSALGGGKGGGGGGVGEKGKGAPGGHGGCAGDSPADEKKLFVECGEVGPAGTSLALGGKGVELSVWDLERQVCQWRAKNPKPNSLGLVEQKWVTSLCHVSSPAPSSSPGLIATGNGAGTIHLFDTAAQKRPVASWSAGKSPVRGLLVAGRRHAGGEGGEGGEGDGNSLVFSTADGMLGLVDIRKGQLLGKFKGPGGALKSLSRHPQLPLMATCGLDRYLRMYDLATRELLCQTFLKQAGTSVVFCDTRGEGPVTAPETEAAVPIPTTKHPKAAKESPKKPGAPASTPDSKRRKKGSK